MLTHSVLCKYLDEYLNLPLYRDNSLNGLQVENTGEIKNIGLAVDARYATFELAKQAKVQIVLCHHGLFWGREQAITNYHYKRIKLLIQNNIALYAAHIPLDAHPQVGNNIVLAQHLQLQNLLPWAEYKGQKVGFRGEFAKDITPKELQKKLQQLFEPVDGKVQFFGQGKKKIKTIGIVTGDAANELPQAAQDGIDAFITGEPSHVFCSLADELGVYLFCAGHYATETLGVKALGEHLEKTFDVKTTFLHAPTFA